MSYMMRSLSQIEQADPQAVEQLLPLVPDDLRILARARLAQENPGQMLWATSLIRALENVCTDCILDPSEALTRLSEFDSVSTERTAVKNVTGHSFLQLTERLNAPVRLPQRNWAPTRFWLHRAFHAN